MTGLPELLGELEDEWGRRGVPVELLRPGISRDEVESKIKALPLDLDPPEELYEWYAWHDGADSGVDLPGSDRPFNCRMPFFPSHLPLSPLQVACDGARMFGDIWPASDRYRDQGDEEFRLWDEGNEEVCYVESHFSFLQDGPGPYATVACLGGETGRVYALDTHGVTKAPPLDSIADLVRGLLKVYELGELNTNNFMNMDDDPAKHSGFETMDIARVEARDPLISNFW